MHFYAWKNGIKTGMYYLRTKAVAKTQQFTLDPSKAGGNLRSENGSGNSTGGADEVCESCSG